MDFLFFPFPDRFYLLLLLPLLSFLTAFFLWNKADFIRKHPFAKTYSSTLFKRFFSPVLLFFSLCFILLAALEPMGKKVAKSTFVKEPKISSVFILDRSASMGAKDTQEGVSRFSKAVHWVESYLQKHQSLSLLSLYVLDAELDKWVHKSQDKALVSIYLKTLLSIPPFGSTDFSNVIRALQNLKASQEKQVVYLLSDGEDTMGKGFFKSLELRKQVEELKDFGVYIFPIAVGREQGADIEVEGRKEKTFLHQENLEKMATFKEGVFSVEDLQEQVFQQVEALIPKADSSKNRVETHFSHPLYLIPLFTGLFLLFLALYFPKYGSLFPFAVLLFLPKTILAEDANQGVRMLYSKEYKEAEAFFLSLLPKQKSGKRAITYYNLANAYSLQKDYERSFFWLSYIDEKQVPVWFAYAATNNQLLSLLLDLPTTIHTKIRAQAIAHKLSSIYDSLSFSEKKEHLKRQKELEDAVFSLIGKKVFSLSEIKEQMQQQDVLADTVEGLLRKVIEEQEFRIDMAFLGERTSPASLDEVISKKAKEMRLQFEKGCAYSPWVFVVPYLDKAQQALISYDFSSISDHLAYISYLKEALNGFKKEKKAPCQKRQTDSSLQIIQQMEQDDRSYEMQKKAVPQGVKPW